MYCLCGCGELAPLADRNDAPRGYIKGQPLNFIHNHHHRRIEKPDYFIVNQVTGCWEWQLALSDTGYAQRRKNGVTVYMHRVYYEKFKGKISNGLHIDHTCCNRACINPDHLEAVTCKENVQRGFERRRLRNAAGQQVSGN